jgi:hypothetical protein
VAGLNAANVAPMGKNQSGIPGRRNAGDAALKNKPSKFL